MAGRGSRFAGEGCEGPKPLIQVGGRLMLFWALKSLDGIDYDRIIFVALREHEEDYSISRTLHEAVGSKASVILLPEVTEGQLCTVMAAREYLDRDEDVLIASSDTYVVSELDEAIRRRSEDCRGIISVANIPGNHWSFARTDATGGVVEVAEKERISDNASTGLYYFSSGREFLEAADEIIAHGERTRGEYYVIPVYQKYIRRGWRVDISVARTVWDMGTPDALSQFQLSLQERDRIATGI